MWVFRNARVETLVIYAQSIYLIFASVYVCKETMEHFLLASGEGHHHHAGDEVTDVFGCVIPSIVLEFIAYKLLTLIADFRQN